MEFYESFTKLCKEKGTTPSAVCEKIGYSRAVVARWRTGSMPRQPALMQIASELGVTVKTLLGYEEVPEPTDADYDEPEPLNGYQYLLSIISMMTENEAKQLADYASFILGKR